MVMKSFRGRLASIFAPQQVQANTPKPRQGTVLMTSGDTLLSPTEYRMNVEQHLRSAMGGSVNVSDGLITRAFGVSATAFSCTEYRAETGGSIPLRAIDPTDNLLESSPVDYMLSRSNYLLFESIASVLLFGRCYWRKVKNEYGYPTGLELINATDVTEYLDEFDRVEHYEVNIGRGNFETLYPRDVVYMEAFDPDPDGNGVSKFEVAWRALNIELAISIHAAAFFVNGARIDGFLSFDDELTDDQYAKAREDWKSFQGAARAHKTAVMPGGAKWNPVSTDPKDLAMTELKDDDRKDICTIFNVHPALIGLADVADQLSANSTFNAVEVQHIRSVEIPFIRRVILKALNEQWTWVDFDREQYYTLDIDESRVPALNEANLVKAQTAVDLTAQTAVLDYNEARKLVGYDERPDYFKRSPAEMLTALEGNVISINEGRALLGLNPVPWGQALLIDGAPVPLGDVAGYWKAKLGIPDMGASGGLMLPPSDPNAPPTNAPPGPPTPPVLSAGYSFIPPSNGLPGVWMPNTPPEPGFEPLTSPHLILSSPPRASNRAAEPLSFRLMFSHNQHVRYCVRTLSSWASDHDINVQAWTPESEWSIELLRSAQWNPADLSRVLRTVDYANTRKVDLVSDGYIQDGLNVYLRLGGDLGALQAAVEHDLETAGMSADPVFPLAVRLCVLSSAEAVPLPTPLNYPLVGAFLAVQSGTRIHHTWAFRAASTGQTQELAAWEKALRRRGMDYEFNPETLSPETAAFIRWALWEKHDLTAVFQAARSHVTGHSPRDLWSQWDATRSIQSTRLDFEGQIEDLIADARGGRIDRREFSNRMRNIIRGYGELAYLNGLQDGGVQMELDELDPAERNEIKALISSQNQFVSKFGDTLFNGAGLTDAQAGQKPSMWFNMSVMPIYNAGLVSADKNGLREWVLGNTEHCTDCKRLSGQKRRLSFWTDHIMPQDQRLECKGFNCQCKLVPARGSASRGRLPFAVRMVVISEDGKRKAVPLVDIEPDSYYESRGFAGMESGVILVENESVRFVRWAEYDLEPGDHVHIPEGSDFDAAVEIIEQSAQESEHHEHDMG